MQNNIINYYPFVSPFLSNNFYYGNSIITNNDEYNDNNDIEKNCPEEYIPTNQESLLEKKKENIFWKKIFQNIRLNIKILFVVIIITIVVIILTSSS